MSVHEGKCRSQDFCTDSRLAERLREHRARSEPSLGHDEAHRKENKHTKTSHSEEARDQEGGGETAREARGEEPGEAPSGRRKGAAPCDAAGHNGEKYAQLARLWLVETGVQTVGLWVNEHVWTGNDNGECFKLEKDTGAIAGSWLLPRGCVAVVSDDAWTYAGCANGCVYDLTGSTAQVAYQLGGANHDWLEVNQGVLCVSDDKGTVSVIDVDGSIRWQKSDRKAREGWVLRTAADGLYHGSLVGLRKYDWGGKLPCGPRTPAMCASA